MPSVLLLNYQFDIVGGMEKSCWTIGGLLKRCGIKVLYGTVLKNSIPTPEALDFSLEESINHQNPLASAYKILWRAWKIAKYVNRNSVSSVISNGEICNFSTILAKRCFNGKFKSVCVIHNSPSHYEYGEFSGRVFLWLSKKLYPYADSVVTVCEELGDEIESRFGVPTKTAYNPIEIDDSEFGLDISEMEHPIFIHVGRLDSVKNQAFILEAFKQFTKKGLPGSLVIAGGGPLESDLKSSVESSSHLRSKVQLLGNLRCGVGKLLNSCDVFLFASLNEGFGRAPAEALAHGIPVVSHDYPYGAKEILRGNNWNIGLCKEIEYTEFGALTPYLDIAAFEKAMETVSAKKYDRIFLMQSAISRFGTKKVEGDWKDLVV